MARFSDVDDGFAARKRGISFTSLGGKPCTCDMRVVTGVDDDGILERAAKHARDRGQKPGTGDPVYDFALACELVALAALDPDSTDDAPKLYFDGGVEQVRKRLDRDRINYLAEQQQEFQASVCPLKRGLSDEEYWLAVTKASEWKEGDADPFVGWAPSLRLFCMRAMACQLFACLMSKSTGSSTSGEPAQKSGPPSPPSSTGSIHPTGSGVH